MLKGTKGERFKSFCSRLL